MRIAEDRRQAVLQAAHLSKEVCMQVPLEISTRLIELTPALEADLRRRAAKLERYFDRITSCRIAVERPSSHHQEGGPYRVRLDITVPGDELIAKKEGEDLNAVVRDAFQAAERQVDEYSQRRRGEVKTQVLPPEGRVVRIFQEEGFGFIAGPDDREIYFHRNAVLEPGFESLTVGAQVRFAEEQGFEGPQATTVSLVGQEG
jgi:ribosomal subunit interface protein